MNLSKEEFVTMCPGKFFDFLKCYFIFNGQMRLKSVADDEEMIPDIN